MGKRYRNLQRSIGDRVGPNEPKPSSRRTAKRTEREKAKNGR